MRIKLDEQSHVIGYSRIGGIEGDFEVPNEVLPQGELLDYRYEDGVFVYDPLPPEEEEESGTPPTDPVEDLRQQVDMLTECLLEMSELLYA